MIEIFITKLFEVNLKTELGNRFSSDFLSVLINEIEGFTKQIKKYQ